VPRKAPLRSSSIFKILTLTAAPRRKNEPAGRDTGEIDVRCRRYPTGTTMDAITPTLTVALYLLSRPNQSKRPAEVHHCAAGDHRRGAPRPVAVPRDTLA